MENTIETTILHIVPVPIEGGGPTPCGDGAGTPGSDTGHVGPQDLAVAIAAVNPLGYIGVI